MRFLSQKTCRAWWWKWWGTRYKFSSKNQQGPQHRSQVFETFPIFASHCMHCASRIPLTSGDGAESSLTTSRKPTLEKTAPIRKRTTMSGSKDDGKSKAKGGEGEQKEAVSATAMGSTKAERRALQVYLVDGGGYHCVYLVWWNRRHKGRQKARGK